MRPTLVAAPITGTSQAVDPNFTICRGFTRTVVVMHVMPTVLPTLRRGRSGSLPPHLDRDSLSPRLGLTVPHEWWASPALVKSFEAAGFGWAQVDAPPVSILRSATYRSKHASAVAASLEGTELGLVVHAPAGLRLGSPEGDEAFAGLISYAAEVGAAHVVYHALGFPDEPASEDAIVREAASLAGHADFAEQRGVGIAVENLAPVYPGPDPVSASPLSLRGLVLRTASDAVGVCLDLGHAHIVAELRHTSLASFIEPVLDLVTVFHLHDNLGARQFVRAEQELGVDPLRLDLHLPPGRGTLPLAQIAPAIAGGDAPVICEVHPPYRPRVADLHEATVRGLTKPVRS
jgi:sugar phosphate isomerase/epimerase